MHAGSWCVVAPCGHSVLSAGSRIELGAGESTTGAAVSTSTLVQTILTETVNFVFRIIRMFLPGSRDPESEEWDSL